jgi:protein associated with RNAse G/E
MSIVKFTISGIYSSALSKLLVDRGYQPTRLSNTLSERLGGLGVAKDEPDVVLKDMSRWQGVILIGDQAKTIADTIVQELGSVAQFYLPKIYGAVYKPSVVERVRNGIILELENRRGLLKARDDNVGLVQVTGYARSVSKLLVTPTVRLRHGSAEAERTGRTVDEPPLPGGWRWRRRGTDDDNAEVASKANDLEDMLSSPEVPDGRCVLQGKDYVELVFGLDAKSVLDGWRAKVTPTINGHHYLKSLGPEYSALVYFAEAVRDEIPGKIDGYLRDTIVKGVYPRTGEEVKIFHMKPDGRDIELSSGYVLHSDQSTIMVRRSVKSRGEYDGFNLEKRLGDYILTEFKLGEWHYVSTYFRRDGTEIGRYANICTPPEVSKTFIRYIDLYVDVVETGGQVKTLDKDQLEDALHKGYVTQTMYKKAIDTAEALSANLKSDGKGQLNRERAPHS